MKNQKSFLIVILLLLPWKMAQSGDSVVYSTDFDSMNAGLTLTGQEGWVTNDPKLIGQPAGEADGLTRLVKPDEETSRAGFLGGPYRAAFPPGNTNVLLWPELEGLGSTVLFESLTLIQPSDSDGIFDEADTFGWSFLDGEGNAIFRLAFEPIEGSPDSRLIVAYDRAGRPVSSDVSFQLETRNLYTVEVSMIPEIGGDRLLASISNSASEIQIADLVIPSCSISKVTAVAANWKMTDAKIQGNGIVTGFGSNYMAFDDYRLSTNHAPYINVSSDKGSELKTAVTLTASICKPFDRDLEIFYKTVDGTAQSRMDYFPSNSDVLPFVIPAGSLSSTIQIPLIQDTLQERDEFFLVQMTGTSAEAKFLSDEIIILIENAVISSDSIEVTNVYYSKITNQITLTWTSNPEMKYAIFHSSDLESWETNAIELIESGGETTIHSFNKTKNKRQFFCVRRME